MLGVIGGGRAGCPPGWGGGGVSGADVVCLVVPVGVVAVGRWEGGWVGGWRPMGRCGGVWWGGRGAVWCGVNPVVVAVWGIWKLGVLWVGGGW